MSKVVDIRPNLEEARAMANKQFGRKLENLLRVAENSEMPMACVVLEEGVASYFVNPCAADYYLPMCGALDELKGFIRGDIPIEEGK